MKMKTTPGSLKITRQELSSDRKKESQAGDSVNIGVPKKLKTRKSTRKNLDANTLRNPS